jgi:hypothetical protein
MSFHLFVAVCILGLDFLIFVLFQWTLGDKRRAMAKKLAEAREQGTRPFLVRSGRGGAQTQARLRRVRERMGQVRERRLA